MASRRPIHLVCFFSAVLCAAGLTQIASARGGGAGLTGQVRDQQGSAIAGAAITLTEIRTNLSFKTTAGPSGFYSFTGVDPGEYKITVEARGFKRFERAGLHIETGERIRLDLELTVGSVDEVVTITSDVPLLHTDSASLGQVIPHKHIIDLPLNGRSFVPLVGLAAGVALPPGSEFPRINGGRPRTNEFQFDGISVLQPEPGAVAFFPVIDAIQEFKVETNSPSAEFGRFNGGVVNLTTKSGTNEFHGSAFEFFRNEALNARNLFAPATPANPKKPLFRRNQFGFVLGGPVVKGRSFFFVDYQGTRQSVGRVRISTVPTILQRKDIFTEPVGGVAPKIFDPATTRSLPGGRITRDLFPGGRIPEQRIDPVARLLLNRYPLPNLPGTANNFRRIGNELDDQNQFDVRADHRISDRDRVFARYSFAEDRTVPVTPLEDGSGKLSSGAPAPATTTGQSLASSYTRVLSNAMVGEFRFGYTRRSINRKALLLDAPPRESLKLPGIPSNAAFENELPTFNIAGYQQLGPSPDTDTQFRTDVTQAAGTLSIQAGRHSIKAGLDLRWERLDVVEPPSPTGNFRFSNFFTNLPGVPGTGSSLASFLLGQVESFSIDLQQKVLRPRAHFQEYFVQDDWKLNRSLTVSAGLRYTLNFPSTEADDQGAVFNLQTRKLEYAGRNGFSRQARELHKLNFGPRLGIAWSVTDKTVVRSAYGLIWIEQAGLTTPFTLPQFPFIQTVSQRSLDNINPAFVLSDGPRVTPIPLTPDAGLGQGVFTVDRTLGSGYAQQWNVSVQRQIGHDFVFELAYTGSKITHLGIPDTNINQLSVKQLALGTALFDRLPNPFLGRIPSSSSLGGATLTRAQLLKPFPEFTNVSFFRNNAGDSSYHALQARLERRFSNGASFLVAYTRSKLLDDASSVFSASVFTGPVANFPVADSFNRHLERDVSNGDIPNNFVASFTYELPFGKGHDINPKGFAGKLAGGWEVAGIVSVQSGLPLAVAQATNFNQFAGFGTQRPDRLFDPQLPGSQRSTARYFNTGAFKEAKPFTLGTSSRNPVRGPGYRNLDLALIKRTPLKEGIEAEFRAEVFNLTNTPPLGAPNIVFGTPGFGSITSAGDPRVFQLALKLGF